MWLNLVIISVWLTVGMISLTIESKKALKILLIGAIIVIIISRFDLIQNCGV